MLAVLLWVRTLSPAFSDFVCRYAARPWIYVIGHLQSILPFSLFELCVLAAIVTALTLTVLLILFLVRKRWQTVLRGIAVLIICILSLCNVYTLIAGFAYYRPAAPVPQADDVTPAQVVEMARYFADDYNTLANTLPRDEKGDVISPYTPRSLSQKLREEYARLNGSYFYSYTPRAKTLGNSWFFTLNNITGVTFVPLAEPTVNRQIPASDLPLTMAHEMAHAKGVAREGEANFVAYYVLLSSQDDYLRYCGYFATFYSLLSAVNANSSIKNDYVEIQKNMAPAIFTEQRNASLFWTEKSKQPGFAGMLNRTFEKIGNYINDLFLKANGADNGSGSYGDKVNDGSVSDTGQTDPDTGEILFDVTYTSVQKLYFALYRARS